MQMTSSPHCSAGPALEQRPAWCQGQLVPGQTHLNFQKLQQQQPNLLNLLRLNSAYLNDDDQPGTLLRVDTVVPIRNFPAENEHCCDQSLNNR